MTRPTENKPTYIPLPFSVYQDLASEPTAFLVYASLLNAVTKELIKDNQRFGVVYDGEPLPRPELASKLGIAEGTLRWGLTILRKKRLAGVLRVSHGLRVFLFDTQKWQKPDNPRVRQMSKRYEWILTAVEEIDAEPQSQSTDVIEVQLQSPEVKLQSLDVQLQSPVVQLQSQDIPDQQNQQLPSPSYRGEHIGGKSRGEQSPTQYPPPPLLESKAEPNGQDEPDRVGYVQQVAKATDADACFSLKSLEALRSVCQDSDFTLTEIKAAVTFRVDPMDPFQLKNAGSLIAANLKSDIDLIRRRREKERATQEMLRASTESEQRKAAEQMAARLAEERAEMALIEETL